MIFRDSSVSTRSLERAAAATMQRPAFPPSETESQLHVAGSHSTISSVTRADDGRTFVDGNALVSDG